jgi:hypothetical protein
MVAKTTSNPQNAYANFDPTQWSNAYSNFNNAALPWPASYVGMPNDAMGNPIQPPAGLTLNSSPGPAPAAAPAAQAGGDWTDPRGAAWGFASTMGGQPGRYVRTSAGGQLPSGENYGSSTPTNVPAQYQFIPQQQQAAPPPQPTQQPGTMDINSALSMLANPGKVNTPGATVAQQPIAAPNQQGLQSFLANWKPAQGGPGAGFQQGFSNALKGMGY